MDVLFESGFVVMIFLLFVCLFVVIVLLCLFVYLFCCSGKLKHEEVFQLMKKMNPPVGWGKFCPRIAAYKVTPLTPHILFHISKGFYNGSNGSPSPSPSHSPSP